MRVCWDSAFRVCFQRWMLYTDCFQLTKACLTAQWIVIRLKLHCKSFLFVLKQVLSLRVTEPKWVTLEIFFRFTCSMKDTLEAWEVSILDSPGNLHDAFKPIDWCGYLLGKGEGGGTNEAQWENRKIITFRKREEDRKRDTGPEEHPCHHISLELMSGTLCCHKSDEV